MMTVTFIGEKSIATLSDARATHPARSCAVPVLRASNISQW
jgi:hypothetical protein